MEPEQERQAGERDSSVVVFLSLYLLLLAFFILLNSISQHERHRADLAMGSVAATFRQPVDGEVVQLNVDPRTGLVAAADAFHNQTAKLFEDTLPVGSYEENRDGNVMRVTVQLDRLYSPDSERLLPGASRLLDGVADALARRDPGLRNEAAMHIGTGVGLPAPDGLAQALPLRRAGAFARRLRELGAPAASIRIGIGQGDEKLAVISFAVRDVSRARNTFTKVAESP